MNISLIIPAYNEENYLATCLQSVAENGSDLFEVIVVNNASTDNTELVAKSFANVRVVTEPVKGLTVARQKGLNEAKGEIVAYIDADTKMPKDWAKKVLTMFSKNPDIVCVSGPYIYYDLPLMVRVGARIYWSLAWPIYFILGYMAVGGNFAARKDALLAIGGFDSSISFYGEDTDIARRLHKTGKVIFNRNLFMYTSGRRLAKEGIILTVWRYVVSFAAIVFTGKPVIKEYKDIR